MKNIKKAVSLFLTIVMVVALLVVPATSVNAAETEKKEWKTFNELVKEKGYINGIQQPWLQGNLSAGNDIGVSMMFNSKTIYNDAMYYELFRNCKAMGFDAVQLWITYQLGGILFDSEWNVIGVEENYEKNFPRVLEIAKECGVYLSLAIIEHCEAYHPAGNRPSFKDVRYEEIYRFMHTESGTKLFIENWLKPILNIAKEYDNVIMANVFVEPEANGGRWDVETGASWANITKFMKSVNDTVKEIMPDVATFAGATGSVPDTFAYYKDIDFDCYGYDYYTTGAAAHDTSEIFIDKPLVYGEFGIGDDSASLTKSDEFMTSYMGNYLDTVVERGVRAGYYWYYGSPGQTQGVTDSKSRPRPFTWAIRAWSLDSEYARTGYEGIDAPTFMYSTSENIRFYGSRGANSIVLERSKDGKTGWKTILSFDPETPESVENYEFGAMMYEWVDPDVKEGETWYYRLHAGDAEGNKRTSETISITADYVTCSEEDNLIKNGGFELSPLSLRNPKTGVYSDGVEGWKVANQAYAQYDLVQYLDGSQSHSGKGSVYRITRLFQDVTLKPNTDYTFTFYYKYDEVEGYWNSSIYFLNDYPSSAPDPAKYANKLVGTIRPLDKNKKIGWVRHTVKFNSGDITDTTLMFYSWHGGANQKDETNICDWHIDDVYLFETNKYN